MSSGGGYSSSQQPFLPRGTFPAATAATLRTESKSYRACPQTAALTAPPRTSGLEEEGSWEPGEASLDQWDSLPPLLWEEKPLPSPA